MDIFYIVAAVLGCWFLCGFVARVIWMILDGLINDRTSIQNDRQTLTVVTMTGLLGLVFVLIAVVVVFFQSREVMKKFDKFFWQLGYRLGHRK